MAYSEQEKAIWREDAANGMSNRSIALKYGLARKTVDAAIPNRSRLKYGPEDIAKWAAALDEGYGYKHVGEMYGVPDDTVRRYLPGRGWTLEQVQMHGRIMRRFSPQLSLVG